MADAIDFDASLAAGHAVLLKAPKLTRMERTRIAWDKVAEEIREETGIPSVSYAYFDTKNLFVVRLRGRADQFARTDWGEMRLIAKGIYPHLVKDFEFKGEGKSPYANGEEMQKWVTQIIKWARSLDGKRELEEANGRAQASAGGQAGAAAR